MHKNEYTNYSFIDIILNTIFKNALAETDIYYLRLYFPYFTRFYQHFFWVDEFLG